MGRAVAFLRAINVGNRRVDMATLRQVLGDLGLAGVETFLASGNVLFDADSSDSTHLADLEGRIGAHLRKRLGYEVATFVRTDVELHEVVGAEPFSEAEQQGAKLFVILLKAPPAAVEAVEALSNDVDELRVVGRHVYWLARKGMAGTTMKGGAPPEAVLGGPATVRGIGTLQRLVRKCPLP